MNKLLPTSTKFIPSVAEGLSVNKSKGFTTTSLHSRGFTLVELMVVITIIGVLSVIGITLFTNVQKNARDAQRRGDIEAISKAFEANTISGTTTPYPAPLATWFASGNFPIDPQGVTIGYFWNGGTANTIPTAASATYVVCAKLENNNGNSSTAGTTGGTFTAAASGTTAIYFCRKNQQ